jgi:hypothetical protein
VIFVLSLKMSKLNRFGNFLWQFSPLATASHSDSPILYKTTRPELSNGVWHMVLQGAEQILCYGRKSAKSQVKV